MLKPKSMTRAVIVGHKEVMDETVETLHDINIFHIEEYNEEDSTFKIGKPFENAGDVSKKLVQLRSISSFLGIKPKEVPKQDTKVLWNELDEKLASLENELDEMTEEKSSYESRLKELDSLKKELVPFVSIPIDLKNYRGYENVSVFTGTVKGDISSELSGITNDYELEFDPNTLTIALFVTKDKEEIVEGMLADNEFREIRVPDMEGQPSDIIADIESERNTIKEKITSLEKSISDIKERYSDFILASDEILSIESQKSEAPLRIATSEHTFVIDGWVPSDEYNKLTRTLESSTDGRVFVSKQEVTEEEEEEVPVEYNNAGITKPFETIMNLYARPKYKEIDPTALIFISFPLFYGMILGDIGYALILLGLAFGVKKLVNSDAIKPLMNILIYCQVSTLIFGVLYAEFLGFPLASLHGAHGIEPGLIAGFETINLLQSPIGGEMITYPIHRTHLVMTLLVFTALVGVAHINLGYILGFINEKKKHGFNAAMLEKGSWIVVEIGIVLAVLGYLGYLPIAVGAAIFVIGFIMLVKGEGVKGPIELPSLLSNSLSYTRLIAVGLSSIYIASTVNFLAFEMIWPQGGVAAVFAIVVFIFGHALNTALSIIAPGLHALRLQYVEFFTKFYEGGGKEYSPFGYIRKYTEE
ncbi:V-type ATP synthase subunit I [Methanohalophilus portucalensis]|uniref:A-type ATP synthase subunit I n=3 Tax=Methanohalophilus portucalensis TaxID=39664 RepID=A0A1X7NSN1_9EURY|nr:V-type ATP synthase subunit I [Methanohalophilus portucalensis]ATU07779.1 V-type ATP synthase subunit I [Methanohalophilus portucalensis]RNI11493.1 V-type ATP synthase subunit I [Methanohalophilus portucalensis FDF-1]SMH41149.1 V/A-type H+-transporting ATPase subunit I [Methanohalophilus portucalensis FDF-1]